MEDESVEEDARGDGNGVDTPETGTPRGGGVCRPGVTALSTGEVDSQAERSADRATPVVEGEGLALTANDAGGEVGAGTQLLWEGPGKIVYEPELVRLTPDRAAVRARREKRGAIPWGFWGGLLFVGVAFMAILGMGNFYTLWDLLWVLVGLTVGAVLYQYGRRSTLEDVTLCRIDERRSVVEWPEGAQSGLDETVASFEEITEVVFGMTTLPVDEGQPDVRVDAFSLLVRRSDDELIPVVEGSPYKGNVHNIAQYLADLTGTDITYVGRGIEGD